MLLSTNWVKPFNYNYDLVAKKPTSFLCIQHFCIDYLFSPVCQVSIRTRHINTCPPCLVPSPGKCPSRTFASQNSCQQDEVNCWHFFYSLLGIVLCESKIPYRTLSCSPSPGTVLGVGIRQGVEWNWCSGPADGASKMGSNTKSNTVFVPATSQDSTSGEAALPNLPPCLGRAPESWYCFSWGCQNYPELVLVNYTISCQILFVGNQTQ